MKHVFTILVAALLVGSALRAEAANSNADGYDAIVDSWVEERDETVTGIVYGYFRGATAESQKKAFARLVELDVKLANENVPLYVTGLQDASNFDSCLKDVVMVYLKRKGISFNTPEFFAGNTYDFIHKR